MSTVNFVLDGVEQICAQGHAKHLVNTIGSDYYGDQFRHDAFLIDRVKTNSKTVLRNISVIRAVMSTALKGAACTKEENQ